MNNISKTWKYYSILLIALCVTYALSDQQASESSEKQPRIILNAKESGIEDLDIDELLLEDVEVDDLEVVESTEEVAEDAVAEVEEVAEEAPAAVEETVEEVVEEVETSIDEVEDAVAEVEEVAEEAPAAVEETAEEVVEEVETSTDEVEDVVTEVEEVAEEAPVAVEETVEEVVEEVEASIDELDDVVAEVEEVAEEAPAVVEETAEEVVEEVETSVDELDDVVAEVEEVAEEAPAVVEETAEEVVEEVETSVDEAEDVVAEVEEVAEEAPAVAEEAAEEVAAVATVEESDKVDLGIDEAIELEKARRKAYDIHVEQSIQGALEDMNFSKYDSAIAKLKDAEKFVRDQRKDFRDIINKNLAEAYYRRALLSLSNKNFDDAEKDARDARQLSHPNAEKLQVQIKEARENRSRPEPIKKVERWNETEYLDSIDDINARMSRAQEYYATGEYNKCRREVEFCLRDYPWCSEAVGLLRKVNNRLGEFYEKERETTRVEMLSDVTKAWTSGNYGVKFDDSGYNSRGINASDDSVVTLGTTEEMEILQKMQRIIIPEIEFRNANITDVITFLSDASREYDPDEDVPDERRGINIILNLGSASSSNSSSSSTDSVDSLFLEDNFSDVAASVGNNISPITTTARYVTLYDAMDIIMQMANLKYRISGNMVLVMPMNAPDGDLIHRMYPVLPSFVEKAKSLREEEKASGDFGDAIQIQNTKFDDKQDWKQFFGELGVQWPEGSTVKYVGSIGKLIVKNTSDQLASLEKVLAELNVTPHQVEIEVRFVEVMQTDLDSLGLEWHMNSNWALAENRNDSHLDYADRRRIEMSAGNLTSGFNFLSKEGGVDMKINDGMPIADGIATFSSILTNPELSVVLHMLSTKKNSDLLSAPKVVTASGREATIKVVTEYIYPTSYSVEMLESDSGDDDGGTTYAGAVVEPSDFMTREVGVILSVTPEVAPDGSRIYLRLAPSVISEPTWKNYGSEYPMSVPVEDTIVESVLGGLIPYTRYETKMAKLPMEQPFFPVRSVVTELDVYNGSTVVMGGMITEERIACEDKIPVLGDIPLIGYLFRNKYEQSEKRNLLLFVTARLVDAGGREVKNPSVNGIFAE